MLKSILTFGLAKQGKKRGQKSASRLAKRRLLMENLEVRNLLSITWTGEASTLNWGDQSNWRDSGTNLHRLPQTNDDVYFANTSTTYQATVNNLPNLTLNSIHFDASGYSVASNVSTNVLTLTNTIEASYNATISSKISLGGTVTTEVTSTRNLVISADIGGSNGLTKMGDGTLTFTGPKSYTGTTTISQGTLQLGDGVASGSVAGNIVNNSSLVINPPTSPNSLSRITGNGTLQVNGQLTVSSIVQDTLIIGGSGPTPSLLYWDPAAVGGSSVWNRTDAHWRLGSSTGQLTRWIDGSDAYFGDVGTATGTVMLSDTVDPIVIRSLHFDLNGFTLSGQTSTDVLKLPATSTVIAVTTGSAAISCGIIDVTSNGSLMKTGAGTLTLSGTDTYTGDTRIAQGSLVVGSPLALQNSTLDMNAADTGTLSFGPSITTATLGGLSGGLTSSRNISLQNTHSPVQAVTLSVGNNNANTTYSGVLSGMGGITKIGTGTLTLTGANIYTGTTTTSAGTIIANSGLTLTSVPAGVAPDGMGTDEVSDAGVRYANGDVVLSADDLGFGVTRTYSTQFSPIQDLGAGYGWQMSDRPYLVGGSGNQLVVTFGVGDAYWFNQPASGNTWIPQFGALQSLAYDATSHLYNFTDTDGTIYKFNNAGQFAGMVAPDGETTAVTLDPTTGRISQIDFKSAAGAIYESHIYTYLPTGDANAGRINVARVQRYDAVTSSLVDVSRVTYTYYVTGGSEPNGLTGDLKKAFCEVWNGTAWTGNDTYYYRYYFDVTHQSDHLLKTALSPDEFQRAAGVYPDPTSSSVNDTQLALYSGFDGVYTNRQITTATTDVNYTYNYSSSLFADSVNTWKRKAVETRPNGTTNTVYTNYLGQTLLTDLCDTSGKHWITWNQYDSNANLILSATPSAFRAAAPFYSESYGDLVNYASGNSPYLNDSTGLFYVTTYYNSPTDPTINRNTAGGVAGYIHQQAVAQGETATRGTPGQSNGPVLTAAYDYFAEWQGTYSSFAAATAANAIIIYPIAHEVSYTQGSGTLQSVTTSHSYSYFGLKPMEAVTTLPVVTADQNGPGGTTGAASRQWYDLSGKLIWSMDERGYLTNYVYNSVTGLLQEMVQDVNTDTANLPLGCFWTPAPNPNGQNLTTDYSYDDSGHVTQILEPAHYATIVGYSTPQNIRTATWTVYLDAIHETRTATGYVVVSTGAAVILGPISITRTDKDGRVTDQIQAAYTGSVANLATTNIAQSTFTAWTTSQYDPQTNLLISTRVYTNIPTTDGNIGTAGVNYLQTSYGYETFAGTSQVGRQNMVKRPDGTITRYVYDARGNVVKTYIGLSDTNWRNDDPSNGGTNGMKLVSANVYDNNSTGGDGLVTEAQSYYDDTHYYATDNKYDWRDRLTDVSSPADGTTTNHIITHYGYDNLDRTVLTQTYADIDNNYFTNGPDPSELRAQTKNLYDSLGRVYESRVYQVEQGNSPLGAGTITNYLPTDYWYDASGNVIKTATGKIGSGSTLTGYGAAQKYTYDSMGRVVMSYTCFDTDETSYADAGNVVGDTVLEQTQTWYDQAGEVVASATYQRLPSYAGTGALSAANSYATASASWYDGIGRSIETANFGREDTTSGLTHVFFNGTTGNPIDANANGIPDAAETAPLATYTTNPADSSGDTYIVGRTVYDTAGRVGQTIDNLGRISQTFYDNAGRVIRTIADFDGLAYGAPTSGFDSSGNVLETSTAKDVTVDYQYDIYGRLATTTAYNPKGSGKGVDAQQTRYIYDTTLDASRQTAVIYPDNVNATQNSTTKVWTVTGTDYVLTHYDRLGRVDQTTDQRGVIHRYLFDSAGRPAEDKITSFGTSGIVDESVQAIVTEYDDVGRVLKVTSYNDPDARDPYDNALNQVQYRYDGWGNVDTEWQEHNGVVDANFSNGSAYVSYEYDDGRYDSNAFHDAVEGFGTAKFVRLTNVTYPKIDRYTAGQMVEYHYNGDSVNGTVDDIMSRVDKIVNNAAEADYKYLGANTIVTEDFSDVDVKIDYSASNFAAWDRFGRIRDQLWSKYGSGAGTLDEFTYLYDRASDVRQKNNVLHSALNEIYSYDNLDRLTSSDRNDGSANDQTWTLDGTGNMAGVTTGSTTQTRTVDKANEIQTVTGGWITPTYDTAGNMITGPKPGAETTRVRYKYDAWNRLVEVDDDGGSLIASFTYDGLNRRVKKTDQYGSFHDYYFNQNWQVVEDQERDSSWTLQSIDSYIWSLRYVDTPMVCLHDGDANGDLTDSYPTDWRRYYLTDTNHNVTTTIRFDSDNLVAFDGVSRNIYTPYGSVTRCDANWSAGGSEVAFDSPLYAGYFFDVQTGLYQARNRYYNAGLSVWLGRDPVESTSNLYAYCGDGPANATDPSGLHGVKTRVYDIETGQVITIYTNGSRQLPREYARVNMLDEPDPLDPNLLKYYAEIWRQNAEAGYQEKKKLVETGHAAIIESDYEQMRFAQDRMSPAEFRKWKQAYDNFTPGTITPTYGSDEEAQAAAIAEQLSQGNYGTAFAMPGGWGEVGLSAMAGLTPGGAPGIPRGGMPVPEIGFAAGKTSPLGTMNGIPINRIPGYFHGNSLNSIAPSQGYSLRSINTGEVLKYGETTLGNSRYSNSYLRSIGAQLKFEAAGAKAEMHDWQHQQILDYKNTHGGRRPPLNKSDW